MRMSDMIAEFIRDMLTSGGGAAELQRSALADRFNCVPSQINYVISTRFSPENGYAVQSQRGGGGYIRITRISMDQPSMLMHALNSIGGSLDLQSARAILENLAHGGAIEAGLANVILTAIGDRALAPVAPEDRGLLRARIFKLCLLRIAEDA